MARLEQVYRETVAPQLQEKLGFKSNMQVPRITKITLNMGVGEAIGDKKVMEHALSDMRLIAGQQPIVRNARKSVAGFKVREGWPVGCKVTLRRGQMYEFLDRLINIAIPRVRDFRGLNPKSFDVNARGARVMRGERVQCAGARGERVQCAGSACNARGARAMRGERVQCAGSACNARGARAMRGERVQCAGSACNARGARAMRGERVQCAGSACNARGARAMRGERVQCAGSACNARGARAMRGERVQCAGSACNARGARAMRGERVQCAGSACNARGARAMRGERVQCAGSACNARGARAMRGERVQCAGSACNARGARAMHKQFYSKSPIVYKICRIVLIAFVIYYCSKFCIDAQQGFTHCIGHFCPPMPKYPHQLPSINPISQHNHPFQNDAP